MGRLVNGQWRTDRFVANDDGGRFQRAPTTFHDRIGPDGPYPPEPGRYHLYVSYACPWAHRTLITRALEGLEDAVAVSVVSPLMHDDGWTFAQDFPSATADRVLGASLLRDVYIKADPSVTTRVTVPILFDTVTHQIVNNESEDILRIFDQGFGDLADPTIDLRPAALTDVIDPLNERIYNTLNNGVYRCGFASSQEAYDEAVNELFDTLDWLESHLSTHRYLAGDRMTEADIRLYVTLIRFDAVYVDHFRCNRRRIADYPGLSAYLSELYAVPAFHETTHFGHIRHHYYRSHPSIHPTGIVPIGPDSYVSDRIDRSTLGGLPPLASIRQGVAR